MKKILANLSVRQRTTIAVVAVAVCGGLYALVQHQRESDFRPLFTGIAAEASSRSSKKAAWNTGCPKTAAPFWSPPHAWRICG